MVVMVVVIITREREKERERDCSDHNNERKERRYILLNLRDVNTRRLICSESCCLQNNENQALLLGVPSPTGTGLENQGATL